MQLRHAIATVALGALVAACATIAGLDMEYLPGPGDASVRGGPVDATTPLDDASAGPEAAPDVELAEAETDSGVEACAPATCADLGVNCGSSLPDGCGNLISTCGTCDAGSTCGAAGPNKCGQGPCDASACTPAQCGVVSNGCGGQQTCTDHCIAPMECGGGSCGGCEKDGTMCKSATKVWPAWKCDDTGPNRGGGCNRVALTLPPGKAYYCCPPPP
jgi:hypothetical protein